MSEDLAHALARLERLHNLSHRDEMRREFEELAQLGGWELEPVTLKGEWTEGLARIHGLPDDATAPGMLSGLELYDEDSRRRLEQALRRLLKGGPGYDLELQLTTTEGVKKWVRTRGGPVYKNGRLVKLRGLLQDITQRKATEVALLSSRRRADAIFERAGIGLAECHAQTRRFVRVNPKLCEILGFTAEELLKKCWPELTHPDDLLDEEETSRLFRRGRSTRASLEKRFLRKDGSFIWLQVTISPRIESGRFILAVDDVHERHQALQALLEQKRRLATIFDLLLAGITIIRISDGKIVEVNPAMEHLLGWTAQEMRGASVQQLGLFPVAEDFNRLQDTFELGQLTPVECRVCRKSGEMAEFLLTGGPALIDGEECVIGVWHDITELRRSDAALHEMDRQARIMFELAPAGISLSDPRSGRILDANQKFCAITGYDLEELLTKTVKDLSHPDDNQRQQPIYESVASGETAEYALDKRYVRKDQSIAWVRVHATILRDSSGTPNRAIAVIEDVTAKRVAEQRLREAEQRSRIALDAAGQGTIRVDLQSHRIELDARAQEYLGESIQPTLEGLLQRVHPDDHPLALETALKATELSPYSCMLRIHRNNEVRWLAVHGLSLPNSDGKPVTSITTIQDITEAKNVEQALLAGQKMEAVGRLAGGIAHDFNNLLTVILSYTELSLEQLAPDEPVRQDLQEVLGAGNRAKELTRQLLAFSRRQVMTLEVLELNSLVVSVERMLARLLGENIAILVQLEHSLPPVRADRGQLEQVLVNLAINSRDAMPGGGRLTISTSGCSLDGERAKTLEVSPGPYVLLTISDNGSGIPEEVRARVFEPFFTTKGQGDGTGLGLAMVYGIVRQTQGAIEFESHPGQGTCFHIYLPASPGPLTPSAVRRPPEARGGSETVLVVEDEPALLKLVVRTLKEAGYRVLRAANGSEALRLGREQGCQIQLVLSDVIMPGISGPQLIQQLQPLCPNSSFLLMSGYPNDALEGHGVRHYLRKPFDGPTLRNAVRTVLNQSAALTQAR
ncbi:PAS domain S-box protein [bacterium]|nr:PAS domain S-box protein [bacterium]